MKHITLFLLPLLFLSLTSFDSTSLIGHAIPLLHNKTLDGKVIDENYFKGHITLVSFMFIGCSPCMNEVGMLNKINKEYSVDDRFQVLCVARQMSVQMTQFNSDNGSLYSRIRKALNVDSLEYRIQPACNDEMTKSDSDENHVELKSECDVLTEKFGVNSFPTSFIVDNNGIVRKIDHGGPMSKNDTAFYNNLKNEVAQFLTQ